MNTLKFYRYSITYDRIIYTTLTLRKLYANFSKPTPHPLVDAKISFLDRLILL